MKPLEGIHLFAGFRLRSYSLCFRDVDAADSKGLKGAKPKYIVWLCQSI